tara:strand:+ start:136 stop:432 length:297 start_codon:yes stop_codon:yes gene_type:complete
MHMHAKPDKYEPGEVFLKLEYDGDEFGFSYLDLTRVFQEVFKRPNEWAVGLDGEKTVFDELPGTRINTNRFTLSFIAKLALRIAEADDDIFDDDEAFD